MSRTNLSKLSILGVFLTAVVAGGQQTKPAATQPAATQPATQPATTQRAIDAQADALVKKMSQTLAKIPQFRLQADILFDQVMPDSGQKIQLANRFIAEVKRPDLLKGETSGDTPARRCWYDGHQLAVLEPDRKVYSIVEVPGTLDAMLDFMMDRYGWGVPVSDLLVSDAYAALMGDVRTGRYLGLHQVGDAKCHHLAFTQDDLDWQIWIDDGEQALPRKLVINNRDLPCEPQFMATLVQWDTNPKFGPDNFKFQPPQGAEKTDMLPVQPAQDD